MSGFRSFSRFFLHHFVLAKLATSSIGVKLGMIENSHRGFFYFNWILRLSWCTALKRVVNLSYIVWVQLCLCMIGYSLEKSVPLIGPIEHAIQIYLDVLSLYSYLFTFN